MPLNYTNLPWLWYLLHKDVYFLQKGRLCVVSFLYFVSLEKRTESGFYWGQKQRGEQKRTAKVCFFDKEGEFPIKPWLIGSRFLIQETVSFQQGRISLSERGDGALALWSNSPSKLIYRPATLPPNRTDMVCFLSECVSCQGNPGGSRKSRKGVLDTILHLNWFPATGHCQPW